ncbi:MAG: hypothetical protein JXB06_02090 [Spirochaetales bacterium]|nr:hypothetical protein [Spirochaetales bacterium]
MTFFANLPPRSKMSAVATRRLDPEHRNDLILPAFEDITGRSGGEFRG